MEELKKVKSDNSRKHFTFYVLVPVYNVENYIHACIDSVLTQTYQDFNLILIDDGSLDSSGDICEEYARADKRIIVIHQRNAGQIAARQKAIRYVENVVTQPEASVIIFLDSDDNLKKEALEVIQREMKEHDCDLLIYGMDRVKDEKIILPYNDKSSFEGLIKDKRTLYKIVFGNREYNPLCRKAISFSLLSNADYSEYFGILHGEDLLQSITYLKNSKRSYFFNTALYNYTVNPDSITQTVTGRNYRVDFRVRQTVTEFLIKEDVFTQKDWKDYNTYCLWILCGTIKKISSFQITKKQKIAYFEDIHKSEYLKKYIVGKDYSKTGSVSSTFIYFLFSRKLYWPILIIFNIYRNLSKSKRMIKRRKM